MEQITSIMGTLVHQQHVLLGGLYGAGMGAGVSDSVINGYPNANPKLRISSSK